MSKLTRTNAILSLPTSENQETSLLGCFVYLSGGVLTPAEHGGVSPALGACVHYDAPGQPASVSCIAGGLAGTVKLKIDFTAVAVGDYLTLADGGTVNADDDAGARTQVGQALEAGVAGEMIEAVIFKPIVLA